MPCGIIEGIEVRKEQLGVVLLGEPHQIGLVPECTNTSIYQAQHPRPALTGSYRLITQPPEVT